MYECECCGGPLEHYEGEAYCPDCTRYEVEEAARQATAEAVQLREAEATAALASDGPADDDLPF
jgi:uncharacterized Zn finger protein (UPF0148 family)